MMHETISRLLSFTGRGKPPSTRRPASASDGRDTREEADFQADAQRYHVKAGTDDMDPPFLEIAKVCAPFTMTSIERMYALYKAVEYIVTLDVPGDLVECGVWRGGSAMVCAMTLLRMNRPDKTIYLYDTYEGLPRPREDVDVDLWSNRGIDGWRLHQRDSVAHNDWAYASLDEVRQNLIATGYPQDKLVFVKGMVEETIPDTAPAGIALLRLDTDWYESTYHELVHLFPRLSPAGVLILDDYGHWLGAKRAVDQYFQEQGTPILLNRIDYSGRLGVKAA